MPDDPLQRRVPPRPEETGLQRSSPVLDWPEVVDRNLGDAISAFREGQDRNYKLEQSSSAVDKGILLVLAIALLASLFFMFYLISVDKLEPVTNFVYPILALILGFMSGYFAGSGRGRTKRR